MTARMPRHTCPDIDRCIEWVNDLVKEAKENGCNDVYHLQRWIIETLEDLRSKNSDLRSCAEEAIADLEEAEERFGKELAEKDREIYDLMYDLEHS